MNLLKSAMLVMFFGMTVSFMSCEKEDLTDVSQNFEQSEIDNQMQDGRKGDRGRKGPKFLGGDCFDLVFPISIIYPDGTEESYADEDALKEALKAWKETNMDAEERPELQFPVDITLEDESVVTVNTKEELMAIGEDCEEDHDGPGEPCAELNFPVTIEFGDGTTAIVNSREEMKDAFQAWAMDNEVSEETKPSIQMPFSFTLYDGSTFTIASEEDKEALKMLCEEAGYHFGKPGHGGHHGDHQGDDNDDEDEDNDDDDDDGEEEDDDNG